MTHELGMLIEGLVAVLLAVTIGYCVVLNRRLKRLRSDETALRQTIADLIGATESAERAIAGLKMAAQESDRTLGERLRAAERMSAILDQQMGGTGRPAAGTGVESPDAQAMLAAANAFAERARSRMLGRAA